MAPLSPSPSGSPSGSGSGSGSVKRKSSHSPDWNNNIQNNLNNNHNNNENAAKIHQPEGQQEFLDEQARRKMSLERIQQLHQHFKKKTQMLMQEEFPEKTLQLDELYRKYKEEMMKIDFDKVHDHHQDQLAIPSNEKIVELTEVVKREIHAFVAYCEPAKIAYTLSIPKMTDNTGLDVSSKQDLISMFDQGRSGCLGCLDNIAKHFSARGKLISKILKKPLVADFKEALYSLDERQYASLITMLLDLRNNYTVLTDYVEKNREHIEAVNKNVNLLMY